jgi:hypothetical protein
VTNCVKKLGCVGGDPSSRGVRMVLRVWAARWVSFASRAGLARRVLTLNRVSSAHKMQRAMSQRHPFTDPRTPRGPPYSTTVRISNSTVKRRPTAFSSTVVPVSPLSGSQSEGRVACHASDFRRHPNRQCSTVLHPCQLWDMLGGFSASVTKNCSG